MRIRRFVLVLLAALPLALTVTSTSPAQVKSKTGATNPKAQSKTPPAAAAKESPPTEPILDGRAQSILIRRTLLTLNDANLSGNYTVLRDLAAPDFQSANDQAKLVGIFADLRNRKIDLAPIVYFDPKLVRQPEITQDGMLRLSGFLPTRPEQVDFDMLFQKVSGRWRLYGIAVNTSPAKTTAAPSAATAADTGKSGAPKGKD